MGRKRGRKASGKSAKRHRAGAPTPGWAGSAAAEAEPVEVSLETAFDAGELPETAVSPSALGPASDPVRSSLMQLGCPTDTRLFCGTVYVLALTAVYLGCRLGCMH